MDPEMEPQVAEVNETAGENVSNATGRDAATTEGIIVTYSSLFVMALVPLIFGSLRSVTYHAGLKTRGEEAGDRIAMKDAAMFPVYASGGLFGLYLFFKFVPKDYVNLTLSVLFLALGVSAICRAASVIINPLLPAFVTQRLTRYHLKLTMQAPNQTPEDSSMDFHTVDVGLFVVSALLALTHFLTKHWILNNAFGLAFCLNAIEMISLDSVSVGALLLGGLFLYDIFWVFGTDVMVTVAKSFEAPIKLMFPMDILDKGLQANNFGMLGLGDIVVPGLFIALLCRFDASHHPKKLKVYFFAGFLAYIIGLGTTIAIMHFFKAAQPALLYLVPSCLGLPFLLALIRGEISALIKFRDYPEAQTKPDEGEKAVKID